MRAIKSITVVTNLGVKVYELGDFINNLEIKSILDVSSEFTESLEIGYRCFSSDNGYPSLKNDLVVEFWNTPVIAEYYEKV